MAKVDIQKKIALKIEQLKGEINQLEIQLKEWERILDDYQINKTTIESILSLHESTDLGPTVKTKKKRTDNKL